MNGWPYYAVAVGVTILVCLLVILGGCSQDRTDWGALSKGVQDVRVDKP